MRRTLSLLFLLCFAWAQAAAAACPMGGGEEAGAPHHDQHSAHAAHAAHGAAHGGHAAVRAAEDPHPQAPAGLGECPMATSCSVIALPTSDGDGNRVPLLVLRSPAWDADRYASPSLTADPPPPRAAVPS